MYRDKYYNEVFIKNGVEEVKQVLFVPKWIQDPVKEKIQDIVFDPTRIKVDRCFNLFQGLALDQLEVEPRDFPGIRLLFETMFPIEEQRNYVINWLAWIAQLKGKPDMSLIFMSEYEGAGKGLIKQLMSNILG